MMPRGLTRIGAAASAAAAAGVLMGGLWWLAAELGVRPVLSRDIAPLAERVAANTSAIELQRWQHLDAKRRNQGLDAAERREYCALSARLRFRAPGCA